MIYFNIIKYYNTLLFMKNLLNKFLNNTQFLLMCIIYLVLPRPKFLCFLKEVGSYLIVYQWLHKTDFF